MLEVRQIVLREMPSASETVNDVSYAVTVGFTFSGRFKEAFCYAVAYRSHVNLGFPQGARLPDPEGRLEGTGALHRHLRIASRDDLARPELRQFIHLAADQVEMNQCPVALKPRVVVKESAARKRSTARRPR